MGLHLNIQTIPVITEPGRPVGLWQVRAANDGRWCRLCHGAGGDFSQTALVFSFRRHCHLVFYTAANITAYNAHM